MHYDRNITPYKNIVLHYPFYILFYIPNISNEDTWKRYYGDRGDYYILPEHYPPLYAFILKKFLSYFGFDIEYVVTNGKLEVFLSLFYEQSKKVLSS